MTVRSNQVAFRSILSDVTLVMIEFNFDPRASLRLDLSSWDLNSYWISVPKDLLGVKVENQGFCRRVGACHRV